MPLPGIVGVIILGEVGVIMVGVVGLGGVIVLGGLGEFGGLTYVGGLMLHQQYIYIRELECLGLHIIFYG